MTIEKFNGNIQGEVLEKKGVVVMKFMAAWCGPCKQLAPIVEEISEEMKDISFIEIDVDQYGDISSELGVRSVPTMLIFKDGKESGRCIGYMGKDACKKKIESSIK